MSKFLFIAFFIQSLAIINSAGQTTRYWSLNFASEPSILAGAVVGGFAENQAVYYNPATISESKSDNIGLSGEIVQLELYKAKNALGKDFDLKLTQFNVVPNYVSVFYKSRKNEDLSFQLAILTRDKNDFDVLESRIGVADLYTSFIGLENYGIMYESTLRYRDIWLGGGVAYRLTDRLSIGASAFLGIKKLTDKLTRSINIDSDQFPDSTVFFSNAREISRTDLTNFKLQSKIGLQYQLPKWRFGLNVSMPSFLITSWAKRYREVGINRIYDESIGEFLPDAVMIGSDKELPGEFKDPLSVAVGINYCPVPNEDMLGVSIEYFAKIPVYKMVDAEGSPAILPDNHGLSNDEFLSLWYGASDIMNVSVGYRKFINESLTLLGGLRTDFDYLKKVDFSGTGNEYNNFIKFHWDVFHITAGARFNFLRHRLVIGAQYSYGNEQNSKQLADFAPQIEINNTEVSLENLTESRVNFKYHSVALFFGFIFNFLDNRGTHK